MDRCLRSLGRNAAQRSLRGDAGTLQEHVLALYLVIVNYDIKICSRLWRSMFVRVCVCVFGVGLLTPKRPHVGFTPRTSETVISP